MNDRNDTTPEPASPPRRQGNPLVVWGVVIVAVVLVVFFLLRDSTPRLTREALQAAQKTWNAAGVTDYDVILSIEIERQGVTLYAVGVRGREVVTLKVNGSEKPPNAEYSIDGIFGWLERELDLVEDASNDGGAANLKGAVLRARFDEIYGYPELYKRIVAEKQSTFIRVTSFALTGGA